MHVRSLVVSRYGPMAPFADEHLSAFTVVHGPNEQGKTLLIDALLRLLFKKKLKRSSLKLFGNLGRVNEIPEGYVVLATHAEEVKLGENDTLSDVSRIEITPEDFRNVFLIRDSDMSVRDEREFYEGITEKLTGIRSSEIDRLLKILQRMGRLRSITPESALANSAETDKIADRVKGARALVSDIDGVRDELVRSGFDELVQELVAVRDARGLRERERERYRAAERRVRFQKAAAVVEEVRALEARLENTKHLDVATMKQWRALSVEQRTLTQDVTRDERAAETLDRDIKRWSGEATKLDRRKETAANRLRDIETALQAPLDAYQHDRADFRRDDSQAGMNRKVFLASIVVALTATVGAALFPSALTLSVAGVVVVLCAALGISVRRTARARAGLQSRAEKLCSEAARRGMAVGTVNEIASAIADIEREFADLRAEADGKQAEVNAARKDRERLDQSLAARRHRVTEIDGTVSGLRARTNIESLDALEVAVDERARVSATVQAKMDLLRSLAPGVTPGAATIASQLEAFDAEIGRALADMVPGDAADDPTAAARLDRQIKELLARERETAESISDGNRRLHAIEIKTAALRVLEEPPRCRTILELDHVREGIEAFCEGIAHEQVLAHEAIRIFQEIDEEERQRVGDLFGVESSVSRLFREFTDGRYRLVTYEPDQNQVYVERVDGFRMRATALSGGAFDQLYLAIRISIAERLLPETGGFFIMDDPFIKADRKRLMSLMRTLERLVERGWQILYFTAKDEVVDALRDGIDAGRVKRIDLGQSLFSPAPKGAPTLWGAQMD